MKTKLVIFDNDGVLGDSEPLIKQAQVAAAAVHGVIITPEWSFQNVHGKRPLDVIAAIAEFGGKAIDAKMFLKDFDVVFSELIRTKLKAAPHIHALLNGLRQNGTVICVGTSSPKEESLVKLETAALTEFFPEPIVFSSHENPHVQYGKPAPDLFLYAAKMMGFKPEECAVVEDAPNGILAAKEAGMYAIGYMGGSHYGMTESLSEAELLRCGADAVTDCHSKLYRLIP